MATARETYDASISNLEQKINEIDKGNKADISRIPELRNEYKKALDAFEIEKADEINAEIERIERSVALRKKQIAALKDPKHPARVEANTSFVKGLEDELEAIKDECRPLLQEIQAAREAYLELAVKILPIQERFYQKGDEINRARYPKEPAMWTPIHGLPGTVHNVLVEKHNVLDKDKEVRKEKYDLIEQERRRQFSY